MAVIKDYYCKLCDSEAYDIWSDAVPECCGVRMSGIPSGKSFEWGAPKQYIHLRDEPFSSRSELNDYAKRKGLTLSPSADKHGGARNDMYDGVGKLYSYKGSPKSGSKLYTDGVQGRQK